LEQDHPTQDAPSPKRDVRFPSWDTALPEQHGPNPTQEKRFPALEQDHPILDGPFPMQDEPFPAWDARLPAQDGTNPIQEKPFLFRNGSVPRSIRHFQRSNDSARSVSMHPCLMVIFDIRGPLTRDLTVPYS
jgi:hypothetical protein